MKVYYTFEQLKKDLPKLKDITINVWEDFDKTTRNLKTREYKKFKSTIKKTKYKN